MKYFFDTCWFLILIFLAIFLLNPDGASWFEITTAHYPAIMGFFKFFILATMGELLGRRIVKKNWEFFKIALFTRALVWGFLGIVFSFVFPIYSAGIDFLIAKHRLYVFESDFLALLSIAFWKSFFMNILFAFPFMTFHRFTDMLIDAKCFWGHWPFMKIWNLIDWNNMWRIVAPTIIWFWIPAHTITFMLPNEYRILLAALLGIVLGIILSIAKTSSKHAK